MSVGFLLLVSLVISAALAALGHWWSGPFGEGALLLRTVSFVVSFVMTTVLFLLVYKILPRAHVAWRDVWTGAVMTSLLFTIGKTAIGIYIGKSGIASGFGAAASLVIILVWVYYSAQILLFGAEFTWIRARQSKLIPRGSERSEPRSETSSAGVGR